MGSFVAKILLFLLIFGLIESNVVDGSRSMPIKNKNGKEDHEHNSKNRTYKHGSQDGTVIGEEDHEHSSENSTYKNFDKDDRQLRVLVPLMVVFDNPNQPCYTQFFVNGAPPVGLRAGQINLWYICQTYQHHTYYGTMFDEQRGIAVFSAYILTQANVNFHPDRRRSGWRRTHANVIATQGSLQIYRHRPYEKGHLVPGATYSNTLARFRSTFVYTNAVPQRPAFNGGQWSRFEGRIRVYAQQCTQAPQHGTLYLITGTAFGHIKNNPPGYNPQVPINNLGPAANFPAINIPNSMWTAGCCVHPHGVESFAVIGNNLQNIPQILTQQIPVARLQMILEHDEDNIGQNINGPNVDLFPGNVACSNVNNNLPDLPPWNGR